MAKTPSDRRLRLMADVEAADTIGDLMAMEDEILKILGKRAAPFEYISGRKKRKG